MQVRASAGLDPASGLPPAGHPSYWDAEGEGLAFEPELGIEPDPLPEEPLPLDEDDDDEDDDEDLGGVSACWNA